MMTQILEKKKVEKIKSPKWDKAITSGLVIHITTVLSFLFSTLNALVTLI